MKNFAVPYVYNTKTTPLYEACIIKIKCQILVNGKIMILLKQHKEFHATCFVY